MLLVVKSQGGLSEGYREGYRGKKVESVAQARKLASRQQAVALFRVFPYLLN